MGASAIAVVDGARVSDPATRAAAERLSVKLRGLRHVESVANAFTTQGWMATEVGLNGRSVFVEVYPEFRRFERLLALDIRADPNALAADAARHVPASEPRAVGHWPVQ